MIGAGTYAHGATAGAATHGHVGNAMPTHGHPIPTRATNSQSHTHTVNPASVTSGSAGSHTHSVPKPSSTHDVIVSSGGGLAAANNHTHTASSGGSHTHSVNVASTTSSSSSHSHTIDATAVSAVTAGTPSVQNGNSYHPVLALTYIIFAGG